LTIVKLAPSAVSAAALLLLALTGCSTAAPEAAPTPDETAVVADGACAADEVALQVDFGSLGADQIRDCAPAGIAADALDAAGISTEGTADYGDQVVCRVDDQPSVEDESCATLPANAYWALWIKPAGATEWQYAEEGVATQPVEAGDALALVYTEGTDSTLPQD
jgi:hypothetical protein